ncbi:TadE family protein [Agromyces sp. M3QZ16-3]|uniref:TadE family protein n=1 Tax=Agromyces sp. M3QZ16-3 TaxID=3447585 RepID=UPI003F68E08B
MPRSRCSTDGRRRGFAEHRRYRFDGARRSPLTHESGSASLEFLTVAMILLVPLVYLVLAMSSIQAAALGVEGAARQAARVAVLRADAGGPAASVERAVRVVLADYGIDVDAASVAVDCSGPCGTAGTRVTVVVGASVALPMVPQVLASSGIGTVRLESQAMQTVSRFAGAP